jgi:hypothetical protein
LISSESRFSFRIGLLLKRSSKHVPQMTILILLEGLGQSVAFY